MSPELAWRGPPAWDATTIQEDLGLLLLGEKDATKDELRQSLTTLVTLLQQLYETPRQGLQQQEAITIPSKQIYLSDLYILPIDQPVVAPLTIRYLPQLNQHWITIPVRLCDTLPEQRASYGRGWGYLFPIHERGQRKGYLFVRHAKPLGEQWEEELPHHPGAPEKLRRFSPHQAHPRGGYQCLTERVHNP